MKTYNFNKEAPVGFFDSGVGGLSVLQEAVKLLPEENFIYYGDSKNAPYGTKPIEEIKRLSFAAADFLLSRGVKALVVACNTATSASIEELRDTYSNIPIIGIEPALKPAVELKLPGKIIIMATPVTLAEKKFYDLIKSYAENSVIQPLPCPGLAELIEDGKLTGEEISYFLRNILEPFMVSPIASIVLGCTHYPFIKGELSRIIGADIPIIDGSAGTARELRRQLSLKDLLSDRTIKGNIHIFNSLEGEEIIKFSYTLLNQ
ncbi:MAG: glutamate racemase [Bacillota bacterium]|nr:glutamate racemase [Bacillota bacterium]